MYFHREILPKSIPNFFGMFALYSNSNKHCYQLAQLIKKLPKTCKDNTFFQHEFSLNWLGPRVLWNTIDLERTRFEVEPFWLVWEVRGSVLNDEVQGLE